ncbi:LytR/AlgR family response regulator transcription factor [Marinilactibacillus psychrotolerans]|uniref:Response regulator n=1 Tax=Marinilactibacillus psychrotolerans TaxID=191770 RepID=A0A5R9C3L9_9LACT|nr:LytTR family transcriptional regulator DNA-binding domain-containing protein [Marinilactibacillus psychrotolerans]TLQ07372.1 response regulator [Marinilactibacillus psychrotolerans]
MNVLIVDDEPYAVDELKYLTEKSRYVDTIMEADNIKDAFGLIIQYSIDLVFLDIHLANEDGLELADKIQMLASPPFIVFATAYDEYAIMAFEKNAKDYILKPFELERVQSAINRVQSDITNKKMISTTDGTFNNEKIPIHLSDRIIMIPVKDIFAVEVAQGKTTIHTEYKKYTTFESLISWEHKLKNTSIMKVHRSYLIHLDAIEEIQPWFNHTVQLTLVNGLKIPVSRSYLREFKLKVGL